MGLCEILQHRSKSCGPHSAMASMKTYLALFLKLFILLNYLFFVYFLFSIIYCYLKRYLCNRARNRVKFSQRDCLPPPPADDHGGHTCPPKRRQRTVGCQKSLSSLRTFVRDALCHPQDGSPPGANVRPATSSFAECCQMNSPCCQMNSPVSKQASQCAERPRRLEHTFPRLCRFFGYMRQKIIDLLTPPCTCEPQTPNGSVHSRCGKRQVSAVKICKKIEKRHDSGPKICKHEKPPDSSKNPNPCSNTSWPADRNNSDSLFCRPLRRRSSSNNSRNTSRSPDRSKSRQRRRSFLCIPMSPGRRKGNVRRSSTLRKGSSPSRQSTKKRLVYKSSPRCSSSSLDNIRVEFNLVQRAPPGFRPDDRPSINPEYPDYPNSKSTAPQSYPPAYPNYSNCQSPDYPDSRSPELQGYSPACQAGCRIRSKRRKCSRSRRREKMERARTGC